MKKIYLYILLFSIIFFDACNKENTADIPGKKTQFDPVACLSDAAQYAGDGAVLVGIYAKYVKPDGTLDLEEEYGPFVEYSFFVPCNPEDYEYEESDTPLGVSGSESGLVPYWQYITVIVENPHWETLSKKYNAGMERISGDGIYNLNEAEKLLIEYDSYNNPLPFSVIWEKAVKEGAPSHNVVAVICYFEGNYIFSICGTEYNYNFDGRGEVY